MSPIRAKIPLNYRLFLFTVILVAWLSGIGTYILQEWVRVDTELGLSNHPQQYNIRRIHGVSAFLMMIIYGYMLASHVPASWKQNRQRISGIILLSAQFILIASGYFIYYFAKIDDWVTSYIKNTHLIVGILFPTMLIAHIIGAALTKPKSRKKG